MQVDLLLVKLDWVLSSDTWGLSFPATIVQPLSRPISDHVPFVINIGTKIPKASCFRFENHWIEHKDFLKIVDLYCCSFLCKCSKVLITKTEIGKAWPEELE